MTQQELAAAVGVKKYQQVHRWETGQAYPRPAQLRKLCEVLEVTPDELLAALAEQGPAEEGKAAA
jgi:transcriptional regulator with XRE-family HTH domain